MPLLAKSPDFQGNTLDLDQHLFDTEQAAAILFGGSSRWKVSWQRFFQIKTLSWDKFIVTLAVACLFHDFGKANDDYQKMLFGKIRRQAIRHEHLSALILFLPEVRAWLETSPLIDFDVLVAAVLSHHMKATDAPGDYRWGQPHGNGRTTTRLDDSSLTKVLRRVASVAGLPTPPTINWPTQWDPARWAAPQAEGYRRGREFRRAILKDTARRNLLLAVKAGLVVSDAAASGLVREGLPIADWLRDIVSQADITAAEVWSEVIEPRVAFLSACRRWSGWHPFQDETAGCTSRGLLLAGCGRGKTLAAWRWAAEQCRTCKASKVLFLYPTQGASLEGFKDYVAAAPEAVASLVHAAARTDLEGIRPSHGDFTFSEDEDRLHSLKFWNQRFFSATVDQFFSFIENKYSSVCLLPVLADSVVVLDEVGSLPDSTFERILDVLRNFNVPVLCMTATLSAVRRKQLEEIGCKVMEGADEGDQVQRYDIVQSTRSSSLTEAAEAYRRGERVLWVANTVRSCQNIAEELVRLGVPQTDVLVYHTRFRRRDRTAIHQQVIERFQASSISDIRPVIAVTTQVCEMSLDLDADLLVTETAPCEALVQRTGRANRHLLRGLGFRARVLVIEPENHYPYLEAEVAAGRRFLAAVLGNGVSQAKLAVERERHAPKKPRATPDESSFLTGGYYARPGDFRDQDEYAVTAVLEDDVPELLRLRGLRRPFDELLLSIPHKQADPRLSPPGVPLYVHVAPQGLYDVWRGYLAP